MKYAIDDDSLDAIQWRAERYAKKAGNPGYTNANRAAQDRQILLDALQALIDRSR